MQAISVTQLNTYIKQIFDAEEFLHNIPVMGEVFGVSLSRNVIYFSLKDENSTLPCVCFYPNLINNIIEGQKLIVTGSPNFYTKGGKLNFNVIKVENIGQGKLYEQFLLLKQKLQDEGLFDNSHKKQLPKEIKRIGVITSREGAVLQDIKNITWRRNPTIDIVLYNTKVQGNLAENEIAHAIEVMGAYPNIDVIIVARGGGSLEDLWAYNTEIVARATYNCPKPIVSAVGHETDFTIIDFVSDLRAPTPSAAAELLTYNLNDKKLELFGLADLFVKECENYINSLSNDLNNSKIYFSNNIEKKILNAQSELSSIKIKMTNSFNSFINQKYYELGITENILKKINPTEILNKGWTKIEQNNRSVNSVNDIDLNKQFKILFKDGDINAKALSKNVDKKEN